MLSANGLGLPDAYIETIDRVKLSLLLMTLAIQDCRRELKSTSVRLFLGSYRSFVSAPLDTHPRTGDPPRRIGRKRFPCARGETDDNARARNKTLSLQIPVTTNPCHYVSMSLQLPVTTHPCHYRHPCHLKPLSLLYTSLSLQKSLSRHIPVTTTPCHYKCLSLNNSCHYKSL